MHVRAKKNLEGEYVDETNQPKLPSTSWSSKWMSESGLYTTKYLGLIKWKPLWIATSRWNYHWLGIVKIQLDPWSPLSRFWGVQHFWMLHDAKQLFGWMFKTFNGSWCSSLWEVKCHDLAYTPEWINNGHFYRSLNTQFLISLFLLLKKL